MNHVEITTNTGASSGMGHKKNLPYILVSDWNANDIFIVRKR
jgi:hypothetical protein